MSIGPSGRRPARAWGAVAAWLMVCAGALLAQEGPRLEIPVVKYGGAMAGRPEQAFDQFRGIMREKLVTLAEELGAGASPGSARRQFEYLSSLRMRPLDGDALPTLQDQEKYWKQTQALQILTGVIFEQGNGFVVRSRFYLGELAGTIPSRLVTVELPIAASEFGNTSDSHSALILYALAMDARRRDPANKALAATILAAARGKIADIENRCRCEVGDGLLAVKTAIAGAEAVLRGRP